VKKAAYFIFLRQRLSQLEGERRKGEHLEHFNGHIQRFDPMFDAIADLPGIMSVYDVGTSFPYLSLYFALLGLLVVYFDAFYGVASGHPAAVYSKRNVCDFPSMEGADLVIATEVLEHLTCNLVEAMEWLGGISKRYLLLSLPCGGQGARDNGDLGGDHGIEHLEHVREFTAERADALAQLDGFRSTMFLQTATDLYRAPIRHYLMERIE
jgi:hypothetical protein